MSSSQNNIGVSVSLSQLAQQLDATLVGDGDYCIEQVATLQNAQPNALSFLANSRYRKYLKNSVAGVVIVTEADAPYVAGNALIVKDAYVAYAKAAAIIFPQKITMTAGIHPSAVISAGAIIDPTAIISANCFIGENTHIAAQVVIGPGCVVEHDVHIGAFSQLVANVTLCHGVRLGEQVILHPGVVIGADGFGIAQHAGQWIKVPQLGGVNIGNHVEVGANTTIDRGAIDDTQIGDGVKIDNQIQIGHNVVIGEHTVIAGCVGISGSTKIGRYCAIGGGTGIAGHIEITDNVQLTGMSMVTKSILESGTYSSGIPIEPTRDWQKNVVRYRQLEKLQDRVKQLEAALKQSSEG